MDEDPEELERDRRENIKAFRAITDGESVLQQAKIQTLLLDAMFSIIPPELFRDVCTRVLEILKEINHDTKPN